MLPRAETYDELVGRFRWSVPDRYNIGADICDRPADLAPDRAAIVEVDESGAARTCSFADLRSLSNRLANLLAAHGVAPGDRVGVLVPQSTDTAMAHVAVLKLGAIAVPLFPLFGPDALEYRMAHCGMKALITNAEGAAKVAPLRARLPALQAVFTAGGTAGGAIDLHAAMAAESADFTPADTAADDPAILIYTSGTTGQPKGALHAHRVLPGHLPGVEMSHDLFPRAGDRIWTPADWAWIGGLLDVLMPALHHGVPVVARRWRKFTAEAAIDLMVRHGVRNAFLPPTALKTLRAARPEGRVDGLDLRSVASGGETLGAELIGWGERVLGVTINEFYGQTECNMVVSSCAAVMPARPGCMGRAVPGHAVDVLDTDGAPASPGMLGDIAVRQPDPVAFLRYWNDAEATAAKMRGAWLLTGDQGIREADGWLRFVGRADDVITSAGYRIGPGEIEDCLLQHPAVAMAGVVGKPDAARTEIVTAFVVVREGVEVDDALAVALADHVRTRLAAHEYPREIVFVADLPMTTTGKVIRRALREM